jgi:glycerophosphoryl diester phosphodiesterase
MISLWDGTQEREGAFSLWDGDSERPMHAGTVPYGARNVYELRATPEFVVAHRLGSQDWAEYSKRGLVECVTRGVQALEISVAKTSDGVWFGLHDQTLLRTSGVDINPTTLTWAQVQEHLCSPASGADPAFGPQPYERLEELIEPYAGSHVFFLDLKYQAGPTARDAVLPVLESLFPRPQDKVIMKYASGGGITLADWATEHGYMSWGHFWTDDYLADPAQALLDAAHWTWIGVDADATEQMWIDMKSTGKPIVGAVVDSLEERDILLAEDVIGYMCANVRELLGDPVV